MTGPALIALLLAAVALVGVGLMLPNDIRVEREITVDAAPATVFAVVDGVRQSIKWLPWAGRDPKARYELSGPPVGVGAHLRWYSDDPDVGSGSLEIVEAVPAERVAMKLVFGRFATGSRSLVELTPEGAGTRVRWSLQMDTGGDMLLRYRGLFLEHRLGPRYEDGLRRLKTLVESLPRDDLSSIAAELVTVAPRPLAMIAGAAGPDDDVPTMLAERYARIEAFASAQGRTPLGEPMTITRAYDAATHAWLFDAARELDRSCTSSEDAGIRCEYGYEGLALRSSHMGPYDKLAPVYGALGATARAMGLDDNGETWEQYPQPPLSVPPEQQSTWVYWPVR
jgi:effector-binding domain-containing protein/uncharacterized protein YndB with AHSA1/START domain